MGSIKQTYNHPQDPEMVMTRNESAFIDQISNHPEEPCILERDLPKPLTAFFNAQTPESLKGLHAVLVAQTGSKTSKFAPHPEQYYRSIPTLGSKVPQDPLLSEISAISRIFHDGTGHSDQVAFMFGNRENANGKLHKHNIPTMTCAWINAGSQWENSDSKRLQAPTGSLFYIPAGFMHGSLDELGEDSRRFLSVWQPA